MKKIFLIAIALLLVSCSPSDETQKETIIKETKGKDAIKESIIKNETTIKESVHQTLSKETLEELTKDELILADIAKAEVEYYGLEKYYSRARIFNMLTNNADASQNISEKVANYAINKANIDFKKNALSTASIYAYDNWWDWEYIEKTLKNDDLFTKEEVKYAMDNLENVDY